MVASNIGKLPSGNQLDVQKQIRKQAVERKMNDFNTKNKKSATVKANTTKKPVNYSQQSLKGRAEGFTESDFGAGKGAAIPYQIKSTTSVAKPVTGRTKVSPLTSAPMNTNRRFDAIKRKLAK